MLQLSFTPKSASKGVSFKWLGSDSSLHSQCILKRLSPPLGRDLHREEHAPHLLHHGTVGPLHHIVLLLRVRTTSLALDAMYLEEGLHLIDDKLKPIVHAEELHQSITLLLCHWQLHLQLQ